MVKRGFGKELNKDYALILKTWPYEKELHTKTALEIQKFNAKSFIEFGCGSGEATAFIHKYNPGMKILATDVDPAVISNAKHFLKSKNIFFKVADALKFRTDKGYDVVSSSHVIHNFGRAKQSKMLKTMYSALRTGGLFIIKDKILPDDPVKRERLWQRQIDRFKLYDEYGRPDLKKKMLEHEAKDKSPDVILIETPFRKMLESVGFRDVKILLRKDRDVILTARKTFDVIVKRSKIEGRAVFAARDFKKGEIVVKWDVSHRLTAKDVKRLSIDEKKYVAYMDHKYILMQPPARYVNHSCDANTYAKDFCDVAKRDIKKGEEITGDYSEDETPGFEMKCNCRSRNCKGIIRRKT